MSIYLDRAASTLDEMFPTLPWKVRLSHGGRSKTFGSGKEQAGIECRTEAPLRDLSRKRLSKFLDRYVEGEADLTGDIYSIVGVKNYIAVKSQWKVGLLGWLKYTGSMLFPSSVRAKLIAVSSHYDLPNDFILSYLDKRTKAYSCAMWKDPDLIGDLDDEPLDDAQHWKFKMAAQELDLQPTDKFLDVGCGYGYMVDLVEKEFGVKDALGITLSKNQVDDGFSKSMKRTHYMDLARDGSYDKIYTCGMISHLDMSEVRRYYEQIFSLLKSGGRFWMHGIVPQRNNFGMTNYNSLSGTFSQKYVFPEHFQFPIDVHLQVMEETGFRVKKVYFRYGHYAKTLRHWYKRYVEQLPNTRHMITLQLERAWHLYLTYGSIMDGREAVIKQILATKD